MFGGDSFEIRLVVLGEPMGTGAMRLIEEGSRESACRTSHKRTNAPNLCNVYGLDPVGLGAAGVCG
jgi:hypothetical protein